MALRAHGEAIQRGNALVATTLAGMMRLGRERPSCGLCEACELTNDVTEALRE